MAAREMQSTESPPWNLDINSSEINQDLNSSHTYISIAARGRSPLDALVDEFIRWRKVPPPPSRSEVAVRLVDLVEGRASRDEVEDWALQWVAADDGGVEDEYVWQALILLSGAALMDSPESYLHCEADFRWWLQEFRQCTSENEDGQSDERSKHLGF